MIALIEENRVALTALCRQFNVRRLELFGSAAKGSFNPTSSDLDFLVTLEAPTAADYADNYLGLAQALEELFQRRVDLVTERSIRNPYFREVINSTRQTLYEDGSQKAAA
jgi:predicted nucleotidyltransferase